MKQIALGMIAALAAALAATPAAMAEETDIEVRVLAQGAKFLPGFRDSVRITLRDAETGEVLATGFTQGGTGNTDRIMTGERGAVRQVDEDGAAVFRATLDIDRARRVTLEAEGPLHQPQARTHVTSTQWILPGRHVTHGDGWLVVMPGLIVDLSEPLAHTYLPAGEAVEIFASVTMLCGCGIRPGLPWEPETMEIGAWLYRNGEVLGQVPLAYTGETSRFSASIVPDQPGLYEIEIRAWAPQWNNAGVARTSLFVQ